MRVAGRGGVAVGTSPAGRAGGALDVRRGGRLAGRNRGARCRTGERGSAVVEFTLVSVVLVTLFLGILQLGLVLHVRNTLVAAAAEGARHAAGANRTLADGEQRTRTVIAEALSDDLAQGVTSRVVDVGGAEAVEIEVTATLPLFGMLGVERALTVTGHAVDEESL